MANNGIVRRIDDLGRIVIPKEIRRNMGLNDGDALEILTNHNGKEIVIRPIGSLGKIQFLNGGRLIAWLSAMLLSLM